MFYLTLWSLESTNSRGCISESPSRREPPRKATIIQFSCDVIEKSISFYLNHRNILVYLLLSNYLIYLTRVEKLAWNSTLKKTEIMPSSPITSQQIEEEKVETVTYFLFLGSKITVDDDYSHEIKTNQQTKTLDPWKEVYDKPRLCIKKQRHHSAKQSPYRQSYGFSISHVPMWELVHKEDSAMLKNWSFWTVVLEKAFESP